MITKRQNYLAFTVVKLLIVIAIVGALQCYPASILAKPKAIYVATNGNDAWSGMLAEPNAQKSDGPFATLKRARDEIRNVKKQNGLPAGGVVVELCGGIYEITEPLELMDEDSGTAEAPVAYRARRGEDVRLVGGRTVTGWKPVADPEVLRRLAKAARARSCRPI